MANYWQFCLAAGAMLFLANGCVTPGTQAGGESGGQVREERREGASSQEARYRRQIAIGRLVNEAQDQDGKPALDRETFFRLGRLAEELLEKKLTETGRFEVKRTPRHVRGAFEEEIRHDQELFSVDTLILGALVGFENTFVEKTGILNASRTRGAKASIEMQLVDPSTGQSYYTATGSGGSNSSAWEVIGLGSEPQDQASLNERAVESTIEVLVENLQKSLAKRPWRTRVMEIRGGNVLVPGGKAAGFQSGDYLQVVERGSAMPGIGGGLAGAAGERRVATLRVLGFFGEGEKEGTICEILDGAVDAANIDHYYVSIDQGDKWYPSR